MRPGFDREAYESFIVSSPSVMRRRTLPTKGTKCTKGGPRWSSRVKQGFRDLKLRIGVGSAKATNIQR